MNVKNGNCIRTISRKSMAASHTRNTIAILAIALTTMLFTSLFTIAMSVNKSFQDSNFRQVGGYSHGGFKYLTEEQYEEIRTDPLIKEYGCRRFVGMPAKEPFLKYHVEISYCDSNVAHWMFCDPIEGRLPKEGTNEAATDKKILSLLGVEPKLGEEFTITFEVDGKETTQTFILCGWWEYDEVIVANHVLIPESRAKAIFDELDTQGNDGITGRWNMDVMFQNSFHIERDILTILENHGFQAESKSQGDNYIAIGVNWGYSGAQLVKNMDFMTLIAIVAILLIIIFTGYLIIYNVFQISVTNDIRFYGLLKTIGTTGRQLRRILYGQALLLSVVGIPFGMLLGYGLGIWLTPLIISQLNGMSADITSANPLIFVGSAIFSLVTVWISCLKPGKIAAKVSPIEAVRYTEVSGSKKTVRMGGNKTSVSKMAWANMGRNKGKTIVTILSLSLAVVLLNLTVTFTNGFDMDKYLANMVADFIIADARYFQVTRVGFYEDYAVPEEVISLLEAQGEMTGGGRIYGVPRFTMTVHEFVSEEHFRLLHGRWNDEETLNRLVEEADPDGDGLLRDFSQLYGMERYVLDKLKVLEGDISKLYTPGNSIAAVYSEDDYGNPHMDSHWAKIGDKVMLHYITEWEYFNLETGEIYDYESVEDVPERDYDNLGLREKTYYDKEYEVVALVTVPYSLSYRYYGSDEFILNATTFCQDTGTDFILQYSFDTTKESNASMEEFISDYTQVRNTQFDYESKQTYKEEFESFRMMFLILGGILSFIIGLVGVLNFLNAILTNMITRKREFAVLQSIGMTGRQLKTMLVWEGMYYALGAIGISLILSVAAGPLLSSMLNSMFWFFTYRFTIMPVVCVAPVFALLGVILPLVTYRQIAKYSVVERLREIE